MTAATTKSEKIVPISSDSHIVEPDNCYRDYIDPKYRDTAPHIGRIERDGKPLDVFVVDGIPDQILVMGVSSAGRSSKEQFNTGTIENAHAGGWNPNARIKDQDRDGIAAEVIYPSLGMVLCGHPDGDSQTSGRRASRNSPALRMVRLLDPALPDCGCPIVCFSLRAGGFQ